MNRSITKFGAVLVLSLLFASFAQAAEPYVPASFDAAVATGKPVLLEFYAPWCTVCVRQKESLAKLQEDRKDIVVFQVDFDGSPEVARSFKVNVQGTIIAYQGATERGRLIGRSKKDEIGAFVTEVMGAK